MAHVPAVRRQSIRVALSATLVVAIVYVLIGASVVFLVTGILLDQGDRRLIGALDRVPPDGTIGGSGGMPVDLPNAGHDPGRPYDAPFLLWLVAADGTVSASTSTPALPAELVSVTRPVTATIDGTPMRVAGEDTASGRMVIAQQMLPVTDAQGTIILGELLIAPFLLVAMFIGAFVIGSRVAAPIEAARRRQLDFTADASHELRTPLAVIEANTTLALAAERDATWYRTAFVRVDRESKRMRRLLEDMLWLARFDAASEPPASDSVDLGILATNAADRFGVIAETRRLRLDVHVPEGPVLVAASPDLVDRLVGVLVDNACKYAPEGGSVDVTVTVDGSRAMVTVDDSGPGIPPDEVDRIFDRFHRSVTTSSEAGGAGLGLAIGDAIVRATGGRWTVATAPAGGARFTVTWSRVAAS